MRHRMQGVDVGVHLPRAARDWAASRGLCCAVLFWDIEAAYYCVVRELAFGTDLCDERVAGLFASLGLPPRPSGSCWTASAGGRPSPRPGFRATWRHQQRRS